MNERIKELELIAAHGTIDPNNPFTPEEFRNFVGKFAELIIEEAINVVSKRYMGDNNREDAEVLLCVKDLRKHFGVEE